MPKKSKKRSLNEVQEKQLVEYAIQHKFDSIKQITIDLKLNCSTKTTSRNLKKMV